MYAYDDGSGSALYVGGNFTTAGPTKAEHLAKWDGSAWAMVGSGTNRPVRAFNSFDDGTGSALYIGGEFTAVDGVAANRIAKWNGGEGIAIEIGGPANHLFEGGLTVSQDPAPSFASLDGADLASSVQIRSGIFVDGFESGDTSQWTGSE